MPFRVRISSLLSAVVLLSACHEKASFDDFPIGIFGVEDAASMATVRAAGFTAIQAYTTEPAKLRELARSAGRQGLRTLLLPHKLMLSTASTSDIPLQAWYLQDEPDVNGVSPQALGDFERKVKAWDSSRATAFVVGSGSAAVRYADFGDAIMVDWYPVPHLPLVSFGEQVRKTVEAAKGKPVWAVVQATDWRWYPQRDPSKPRIGRFPEIHEMRFMSYHAILEGARGLWYFTYKIPEKGNLSEIPELWFGLACVAREMAAMRPIFRFGKRTQLPLTEFPQGMAAGAWRWRLRDYVIIANSRQDASLKVPDRLLERRWRPLFEDRRDIRELLVQQQGAYFLPPFRVLVLESDTSLGSTSAKTPAGY